MSIKTKLYNDKLLTEILNQEITLTPLFLTFYLEKNSSGQHQIPIFL